MLSSPKRIIRIKQPIRRVTRLSGEEIGSRPRREGEFEEAPPPEVKLNIGREAYEQELDQSYQKGLEAGKAEGTAQARTELAEVLKSLTSCVENLHQVRDSFLAELSDSLLEVVVKMVVKIAGPLSASNSTLISDTLKRVFGEYEVAGKIRIVLNPQDYSQAEETARELRQFIPDLREVGLIADETIHPGGCIIETDFGKLDARIETQMDELSRRIGRYIKEQRPEPLIIEPSSAASTDAGEEGTPDEHAVRASAEEPG